MRTIGAAEFKARCLAIIDEVARSGEPVQVAKRGKVMVRLVPALEDEAEYAQDTLAGTIRSVGDVLEPSVAEHDIESLTGRELEHARSRRR